MIRKFLLVTFALIIVVLAGCQTLPSTTTTTTIDPEQAQKNTKVSIEIVDEKEEPIVETEDGTPVYKDFTKSEYTALKGKEPLVLFFHADWCPVCRVMEKEINEQLSTFPKGTKILKADYDTEDALKKEYNIKVQSTIVVLDGDGNAIYTAQDPTLEDLKAAIEKSMAV